MPHHFSRKTTYYKLLDLLISLFIVIAILAIYFQVRKFNFVGYDDNLYVTENSRVQSGLNRESILWAFTATDAGNWHPITWLSHMLDIQLYGMKSGNHHLTNVFFHTANSLLLFFILMRMSGAIFRSGFVAALFALHPLHVESVAWVAERKDVLCTFFWMLTIWSYIRYVESPKVHTYIPVFFFFLLGLLAKPMLVTLPFLLLLLDYWPLNRFQFGNMDGVFNDQRSSFFPGLVLEKIPLVVLAAVSSVITYFVQRAGGAVNALNEYSLDVRIFNALVSYIIYIKKMIWPVNLSFFYPHPEILPAWQVVGASILLFTVFFMAMKTVRTFPWFVVGWLWYVGTLIPVIGLVQVGSQAMADRYTYVPLVGLFIVIAWGLQEIIPKWRYREAGFAILVSIILSLLAVTAFFQVRYWSNSTSLFRHALYVNPNNYIAHNGLGIILMHRGGINDAINHYYEAIRIKPYYAKVHNNLGTALMEQGKLKEALQHYFEALRIEPDYPDAHNNLGVILKHKGRIKDAIRHFKKALRIKPDHTDAHNNLGLALVSLGNFKEAMVHYSEVLRIRPDHAKAHFNMGNALSSQGHFLAAAGHYTEALRVQPDYAEALNNLGVVLVRLGNVKEAIPHYFKAIRINPEYAEAYYNLGNVLARQGRFKEAIGHYFQALRIKPDFLDARQNLENILLQMGNSKGN